MYLETFVRLPQEARIIHDANRQNINIRTYCGDANLKNMSRERFKSNILDLTGQLVAADLDQAAFSGRGATLNEEKMQDKHRELITSSQEKWLHGILFGSLCPQSAYKPEDAVEKVMQIFKCKTTGNYVRLPMNNYMGNFLTAMACIDKYPFDMVNLAIRNMDPAVKDRLIKTYKKHREARSLETFA